MNENWCRGDEQRDMASLLPLNLTDVVIRNASRMERICDYIPVIGWLVSSYLFAGRHEEAQNRLRSQLSKRPSAPETVWGDDPKRVKCGTMIARLIAETTGRPTATFIPEDPMFLIYYEDSDEVFDLIRALEKRLGSRVRPLWDRVTARTLKMTLGEFVDLLIADYSDIVIANPKDSKGNSGDTQLNSYGVSPIPSKLDE